MPTRTFALLRSDPARFSGVFVSHLDRAKLTALAAENKLKLRGPVVVSEASLEASAVTAEAGVVFGPFSAARINKQAVAEEKARLAASLEGKEQELAEALTQLGDLQDLVENLRELHGAFGEERPDALQHRSGVLQSEAEGATREVQQAAKRQKDNCQRTNENSEPPLGQDCHNQPAEEMDSACRTVRQTISRHRFHRSAYSCSGVRQA